MAMAPKKEKAKLPQPGNRAKASLAAAGAKMAPAATPAARPAAAPPGPAAPGAKMPPDGKTSRCTTSTTTGSGRSTQGKGHASGAH